MANNRHRTKLYYQQHGAGYGMDTIHSMEETEKDLSDRYFTSGWGSEAGLEVS